MTQSHLQAVKKGFSSYNNIKKNGFICKTNMLLKVLVWNDMVSVGSCSG